MGRLRQTEAGCLITVYKYLKLVNTEARKKSPHREF